MKKFSSGGIAQLVEQMTFNHWVQSSSLCASTKNKKDRESGFFYFCEQQDENLSQRSCQFDYEFVFANDSAANTIRMRRRHLCRASLCASTTKNC